MLSKLILRLDYVRRTDARDGSKQGEGNEICVKNEKEMVDRVLIL